MAAKKKKEITFPEKMFTDDEGKKTITFGPYKKIESQIHKLKLNIRFCDAVADGRKPFEVRNNDRCFQTGDVVIFLPVDDEGKAVHHEVEKCFYLITYIVSGWGVESGYVVFGIKEAFRTK